MTTTDLTKRYLKSLFLLRMLHETRGGKSRNDVKTKNTNCLLKKIYLPSNTCKSYIEKFGKQTTPSQTEAAVQNTEVVHSISWYNV